MHKWFELTTRTGLEGILKYLCFLLCRSLVFLFVCTLQDHFLMRMFSDDHLCFFHIGTFFIFLLQTGSIRVLQSIWKRSFFYFYFFYQTSLRFWFCCPLCHPSVQIWSHRVTFTEHLIRQPAAFTAVTFLPKHWRYPDMMSYYPAYLETPDGFVSLSLIVLFHLNFDRNWTSAARHCPSPYHLFISHVVFVFLHNPWSFWHSIASKSIENDTHKRWLSGFGFWAILHVTHPLAITSANKLIQRARSKHAGMVGGQEVRRGLGFWKGLEDSLCSVLSSLNLLPLWVKWQQFKLDLYSVSDCSFWESHCTKWSPVFCAFLI